MKTKELVNEVVSTVLCAKDPSAVLSEILTALGGNLENLEVMAEAAQTHSDKPVEYWDNLVGPEEGFARILKTQEVACSGTQEVIYDIRIKDYQELLIDGWSEPDAIAELQSRNDGSIITVEFETNSIETNAVFDVSVDEY